jgi:acetyl-CoA synthetase
MSEVREEGLSALLHETRTFPPPEGLAKRANAQPGIYDEAKADPLAFWASQAEHLTWATPWTELLDWSNAPFAKWFVGGKLNVAVNCVDRHVDAGLGDRVAFHWEGEPGDTRTITYRDLLASVSQAANALIELGVRTGDKVAIYMPMIPETVVAMLACARLGAPHTVVFGGFSSDALRGRILDCDAHFVITADGGYRRGAASPLKAAVDDAVAGCPDVEKVLVVRRTGQDVAWTEGRDVWWHDVVDRQPHACRGGVRRRAPALHHVHQWDDGQAQGDPAHLGRLPDACLGHAPAHLRHQARRGRLLDGGRHRVGDRSQLHRVRAAGQRHDLGHVRGHAGHARSGPLVADHREVQGQHPLHGAHHHPDVHEVGGGPPGRARSLQPAPARFGGGAHQPRGLDLVPHPHRRENCPIVDTWWQTETGGILITPLPGITATKPGAAMTPFPGISVDIIDNDGRSVGNDEGGYLVITEPWPGMLRGIYGDDERYKETYWSRFPGRYFAGDGAKRDQDGDIWLLGRVDDVMNISGHRISTTEVEHALVSHPPWPRRRWWGRATPPPGRPSWPSSPSRGRDSTMRPPARRSCRSCATTWPARSVPSPQARTKTGMVKSSEMGRK